MADRSIDEVIAAITEEDTVGDSLIALTADLKQKLADALSGVTLPAGVQAKINSIFDSVSASKQKYADAVLANTPQAPA